MRIFKYPLELTAGVQLIPMARTARIVHVCTQHERPTLWAEVDNYESLFKRGFCVVGTGHIIPDQAIYIGTTHIGDNFVWHIYEVPQ
jgi:hypothetical protein